MIKLFNRIIDKLSGRPAELEVVFGGEARIVKFENNYRMRSFMKLYKENFSGDVRVVYKRKEWYKQLTRIWCVIELLAFSILLIFSQENIWLRAIEVGFVILCVASFRKYVITMDW